MNVNKVDDNGNLYVILSGSILGTADGVLATADYWHYLQDAGLLLGASTGMLHGSSANGPIDNLMVPTINMTLRILIRGTSDFSFKMLEAPTVAGSGIAVSGINFSRDSIAALPCATFYHSSSLSATGLTLYNKYVPSGEGKFGGGNAQAGQDWALAAGTVYALRIVPHQIGTFNISGEFYCD